MAAAMKKLTKTLKSKSGNFSDVAEQAWVIAQKLGEPRSYLQGWTSEPIRLPEHPLIFSRNSFSRLSVGKEKHHHHRFVLILSLKGSGTLCLDEQIVHLREMQALLIWPFQFHHYISCSTKEIRWIYITFECDDAGWLELFRETPCSMNKKSELLLKYLLESAATFETETPRRSAEIQLWLTLLLRSLMLQKKSAIETAPIFEKDTIAHELLGRVNRFLYRNISRKFTLKELSKNCAYSESHLRNLFKSQLRLSLGHYIADARLRKAVGMLHQNKWSITQVSQACGFSSIYAFSRAFHQKFSIAPRGYRAKYCKL